MSIEMIELKVVATHLEQLRFKPYELREFYSLFFDAQIRIEYSKAVRYNSQTSGKKSYRKLLFI